MKERQQERLKQEEEFKKKKKLASKSEVKVEILVSQPPNRSKTNEESNTQNEPKRKGGEAFFVDLNRAVDVRPEPQTKKQLKFEKDVAKK